MCDLSVQREENINWIEKQSVATWIRIHHFYIHIFSLSHICSEHFHVFMLDLTTFCFIFGLAKCSVFSSIAFGLVFFFRWCFCHKTEDKTNEVKTKTPYHTLLMILNWLLQRAVFSLLFMLCVRHWDTFQHRKEKLWWHKMNQFYFDCKDNRSTR